VASRHELTDATARRVGSLFPPYAHPSVDAGVNAALDELERYRERDSAGLSSTAELMTGVELRGALYEFIESGDFSAGDELRWERPYVGEVHLAHVDANGCIVTSDGVAHTSPSSAASHAAPGRHRPWEAWHHVRSDRSLSWWREQRRKLKQEEDPSGLAGLDWRDQVRAVLERLPAGTWTAYADLSRLTGHHQREIGGFLARTEDVPNPWRVLLANGRVSPNFEWIGEDLGKPEELLRKEGVRFSPSGVADMSQRQHAQDLRRLFTEE